MKREKILIENSVYSVFLYMLIVENWEESIFILDQSVHKLFAKHKNLNLFFYNDLPVRKKIYKFYLEKIKLILFLLKNKVLFNKNIKVYGDDLMVRYFFIKREFFLIEDGTWSYKKQKKLPFYKSLIRIENPFYIPSGEDLNVKKYYLTGLAPIPERIKDKVEIINLKKLWKLKTKENKKKILNIFDLPLEKLEILKKRSEILFTQPLSEDGTLSEKEKIELYKQIIEKYDKTKLVIKKHPREKTDYKKYFEEVEVLEQIFPAELLEILEIKFEKAITIFSTAALTVDKNIKIDFYGTEIHPKILKKFGSMDDIMKRNAFL